VVSLSAAAVYDLRQWPEFERRQQEASSIATNIGQCWLLSLALP